MEETERLREGLAVLCLLGMQFSCLMLIVELIRWMMAPPDKDGDKRS